MNFYSSVVKQEYPKSAEGLHEPRSKDSHIAHPNHIDGIVKRSGWGAVEIVKPRKSRVILGAPIAIQGPPSTVHVTSPTSSLSSVTVSVEEMVPLIFVAWAGVTKTKSANNDRSRTNNRLAGNGPIGPPSCAVI